MVAPKNPSRGAGKPMARPVGKPSAKTGAQTGSQTGAKTGSQAGAKSAPKPASKPTATAEPKPSGTTNKAAATAAGKPAGAAPRGLRVVEAQFVAAVSKTGEVPEGAPEIAFVGRSNVGKSSLLNALCNRHQLARTSRTPGRTQRIVLFDARLSSGQTLRLADLPGFGHAEVSKQMRVAFGEMIQFYLLGATQMRLVLILQDCRRDRDDDAIGFASWLRENGVPYDVVATKADELPRNKLGAVQARLRSEFGLVQLPLAVSTRDGRDIEALLMRMRNAAYPRLPKAV